MQKHVFLIGQLEPVQLKEMLASNPLRIVVHDNEEYSEDKDVAQEFSVGQAVFTLRDFLRPFT